MARQGAEEQRIAVVGTPLAWEIYVEKNHFLKLEWLASYFWGCRERM